MIGGVHSGHRSLTVSAQRDRTRESYSHSHSHLHTANLESPVKLTDMPVDCGKTVYSCSVGDSFLLKGFTFPLPQVLAHRGLFGFLGFLFLIVGPLLNNEN